LKKCHRHTFIDTLKQGRVDESIMKEPVGHNNPSITMSRYGKRYSPKTLLEDAIMKLGDFGLDLGGLKTSRFVRRL
jgi:hypothetical protein